VVSSVAKRIKDPKFQDLFRRAIETELSNLNALREAGKEHHFPIQDIGVAQGCSLSPLVGNIYLREFDARMNSTDVLCLRYIDDFIVMGPNESETRLMFNRGLKILEDLGLSAYLPEKNSDKASSGPASKAFDYLGCTIDGKLVRPSGKSWGRLRSEIQDSLHLALQAIDAPPRTFNENRLDFSSLVSVNARRIESWIKQYEFCNDKRVISQWSSTLESDFHDFEVNYFKLIRGKSPGERARLLGWPDLSSVFADQKK
jgi:hypothetical protein